MPDYFKNSIQINQGYLNSLNQLNKSIDMDIIKNSLLNTNAIFEAATAFTKFYPDFLKNALNNYNNINIISDFYKNSLEAINIQNNAFLSLTDSMNKIKNQFEKNSINNLLRLTSIFAESNDFIHTTNTYFTERKSLNEVNSNEKENKYQNDDFDTLLNAEQLLHRESKDIIITSNDLLLNEIEDLKKDVNELKEELSKKNSVNEIIFNRIDMLFNPTKFVSLLRNFSTNIAKESWKIFWDKPGEKFISKPEQIGKGLLGTFLNGFFNGVSFVGTELNSGNGFIDILVNFLGIDHILELKILGAGWSFSWVESGVGQLFQYMKNYKVNEGYIVVFDGRKTDRGKSLPETITNENKIIYVIMIPIYFK